MARVIIKELDAVKKSTLFREKPVSRTRRRPFSRRKRWKRWKWSSSWTVSVMQRTVDTSVYERNKEAADAENKYVLSVMNTDKISILTDSGRRISSRCWIFPTENSVTKESPSTTSVTTNSTKEQAVAVESLQKLKMSILLFTTKKGMLKQMEGSELDVAKRAIAATKLMDDDELISVETLGEYEQIVLQTHQGFFLRFPIGEIPMKKKNAVGVRGIKMAG